MIRGKEKPQLKRPISAKKNIKNQKDNTQIIPAKIKSINFPNDKAIPQAKTKSIEIKQPQRESKNTISSLHSEIDNLTSIYNALAYANMQLDITFAAQRDYAEKILSAKSIENLKLKEENFKLYSKVNSMENISNIDEYLITNYDKIMTIAPKLNNAIENMNDFVTNINYGIDRLYLDGDIVCDETKLRNTIDATVKDIEVMNEGLKDKKEVIDNIKNNYCVLYQKLNEQKELCQSVDSLLSLHRCNVLGTNIEQITNELVIENKNLMKSIIND